jgi:transglutaminase-like putative cysteine protease
VTRTLALVVTLLTLATSRGGLWAQAPLITPAGDPSVRSDTLYRLAAEARTRYGTDPGIPYAYLLDDGVVRLDAEGRGTRTYRQVVYVLQKEGVETWAEMTFAYQPAHQKLTVNWIKVLREDGTVISEKPSICQESDVPADADAPVYIERKVQRCSLSQVAPGTIIDFSSTLDELKPTRPGDFSLSWRITPGRPTLRSRYVVDLPATLRPAIVEENLPNPVRLTKKDGRVIRTWTANDLSPIDAEPLAADSNNVIATVSVTSGTSWSSVGTWFAGLAEGRDTLTPGLRARLDSIVAGSSSRLDSLRAVHRYVAQDVRYVSVALGQGGYQPRPPAEVVSTGIGDCKDKAMLFVAMARALGYTAYPVLLNSSYKPDPRLASIEQLNHAIAVVMVDGKPVYTDLTADIVPFGLLPGQDQDQLGVVVRSTTVADTTRLPQNTPEMNQQRITLTGVLSPDGRITASYDQVATGNLGNHLRYQLSGSMDTTSLQAFGRQFATALIPGARAEDVKVFDGRDLSAEPRISMRIIDGQAGKKIDSRLMLLTLPFSAAMKMADAATTLEAQGKRRFPIDVEAFIGASSVVQSMRLTLPEGWKARVPPPVDVDGVWGTYTVHYRQEGRELVLDREMTGRRGIQPPEAVTSLIEWMRAAAADETAQIVLDTPAPTP